MSLVRMKIEDLEAEIANDENAPPWAFSLVTVLKEITYDHELLYRELERQGMFR